MSSAAAVAALECAPETLYHCLRAGEYWPRNSLERDMALAPSTPRPAALRQAATLALATLSLLVPSGAPKTAGLAAGKGGETGRGAPVAPSGANAPAPPCFEDVTARAGIHFTHTCGSPEKDWILEVNGSGVALFDADGDGDLDLYFVNGSRLDPPAAGPRPRNALYRNEGGWRFTDVTEASGTGDTGWGSGAAVADADNDGDLDLYVTNWGPNVLFLNTGGGRFERAVASGTEDPGWGAGSSFADFDRDGLVDLYVANYLHFDPRRAKRRGDPSCFYKGVPIFCGPGGLEPQADRLFINEGGGRFRDGSEEWGIHEVPPAFGLGTLAVDVNRDGYLDLLVANDTHRNYCFINEGGNRLREAALYLGLAYNDYGVAQASMGLASGDLRGLGRDDIFVTNYEDDTNTLYLAEPDGLFVEGTYPAGLGSSSYRFLGWGAVFLDAENDGDLDLFVANGHLAPQADGMRSSPGYRQRNQLFLNDGRGRFQDCRAECGPGLAVAESSRGAAAGDLDGDGDLDLVVSNIDAAPALLENRGRPAHGWIEVSLEGTRSNRSGVGARVTVEAGGRRLERTVQSGMSYASQSDLALHFGLGSCERVDSIRVDWPSGVSELFQGTAVRRRLRLREGVAATEEGAATSYFVGPIPGSPSPRVPRGPPEKKATPGRPGR